MTAMTATTARPAQDQEPAPSARHGFALRASAKTPRACKNIAIVAAIGWGADKDTAALIAVELTANAVSAALAAHDPAADGAEGPMILFRVSRYPGTMRIEVFDRGGGQPVLKTPDPENWDAENGRGLFIVDNCTDGRWGWNFLPAEEGCNAAKRVWAEIPARAPLPGKHPADELPRSRLTQLPAARAPAPDNPAQEGPPTG